MEVQPAVGHSLPMQPQRTPSDDVYDKKELGESYVIAQDVRHAAEYSDFLTLKQKYDNDPKALKRLIRKLDLRVVVFLWFFYFMNALDRSNAGNVRIYTFLQDTNMTALQFSTGLTIYSCFYGGLEVPAQMVLQRVGPRWFLSTIVCGFGLVTCLHVIIPNHQTFWALRALLGIFEAGIYQGCFYIMSRWYLPSQLQKRNAFWYTATVTSGAIGGLIAYAVGPLQNRLGYKQWQWLFLIEGLITVTMGLLGFIICPDLPGKWKPRFFSADEIKYLEYRVKYKDGPVPPSATILDRENIIAAFKDWKTYVHGSLLAFGGSIPTYSVNYTLATMVKAMGYQAVQAQALTAPPYFFAIFVVMGVAWYSDKYQSRTGALLISYGIGMVGTLILWPALHYSGTTAACYLALFLIVGGYNAQGPAVGALATNFRNPAKRAVAMGICGTVGQIIGGVGGANIFIATEAPYYPTGFSIIVASVICGGVLPILTYWYILSRHNKRRNAMEPAEIRAKYSEEELMTMGENSPLFRFTL